MHKDVAADIVLSDVDGTLVDNNHQPIAESAEVLQRVSARVPFCLVSARSPEGLYPLQRALGISGPLACFSGAYVLDHEGNELLSEVMPTEDAVWVKSYVAEHFPDVLTATYGFHDWIVDDRSDPRVVREEYYVAAQSRECSDLEGTFGERGVHKLLLMGEPASILAVQKAVSERFPALNAVRSNSTLCEVMSGKARKSRAVEVLCAHYGVPQVCSVAFGDGPNDIDMLEAAGTSYAMANAEASVKEAATFELPWTNEECGVARMLQRLVLEK